MSDTSQPVAGWYPDPENAAAERWWDGTGWTDHRRAATMAPPADPYGTPSIPAAPVAPAAVTPAPVAPVYGAPDAGAPTTAPAYVPPAAGAPGAAPAAYGAPAYNAYASPYGTPGYAPTQNNNLALIGIILAAGGLIISFGGLTSLAGAIISIFALQRANRMRQQGQPGDRRGLAIAGIIVGFVVFALVVVAIIVVFAVLPTLPGFSSDFSASSYS